MKHTLFQSTVLGFGLLVSLAFNIGCQKENDMAAPAQTNLSSSPNTGSNNLAPSAALISQTRTANKFNDFGEAYVNLWSQEGSQYVSTDDNVYAYSKKLSTRGRSSLLLILQDFRFDIPSNASIENIIVSVRRFKQQKGSVKDYFASLVRRFGSYPRNEYGIWFTKPDNYPSTETEVIYAQKGTGSDGSFTGDQLYQWTPAIVNDPAFGVRIDNFRPTGGTVVIYYDQVQITVEYSLP